MDTYTETKTTSWFSRLGSSFKSILLGIILFFGSFYFIYWNEGRENIGKTALESLNLNNIENTEIANGKFISFSKNINSDETLKDDLFFDNEKYLAVTRESEIYAWQEKTETETETNLGGSETTKTTYSYYKDWTSSPTNSSNFKHPEEHYNPSKTIENDYLLVNELQIGDYKINTENLDLPSRINILPVELKISTGFRIEGNYIYKGSGTNASPIIGDERISYQGLEKNFYGTVFGMLENKEIKSFYTNEGNKVFRIFRGDRNSSLSKMDSEYKLSLWGFRFLGFLIMFIGLQSIINPINVILDVVPVFGSIGRFATGTITFVISLLLTVITIFLSIIIHNIFLLILFGMLFAGLGFYIFEKRNQNKH